MPDTYLGPGPHERSVISDLSSEIDRRFSRRLFPALADGTFRLDGLKSFPIEPRSGRLVRIHGLLDDSSVGSSIKSTFMGEEAAQVDQLGGSFECFVRFQEKGAVKPNKRYPAQLSVRLSRGSRKLFYAVGGAEIEPESLRLRFETLIALADLPIEVVTHNSDFLLTSTDESELITSTTKARLYNPVNLQISLDQRREELSDLLMAVLENISIKIYSCEWQASTEQGSRQPGEVKEGGALLTSLIGGNLAESVDEINGHFFLSSLEELDAARMLLRPRTRLTMILLGEEIDDTNYINIYLEATPEGYFFKAESKAPVKRQWVRDRYGLDIPVKRAF